MSCSHVNNPEERDADTAKDAIAEGKAKIQGAGEVGSSDSSDRHAGLGFSSLPCTEICATLLEV